MKNVLSASGLEFDGTYFYIIGDDSPYLYILDPGFKLVKKEKLFEAEVKDTGRIRKKQKPDFEALTFANWNGKKRLLMFGSGSKEQREKLLVVHTETAKVKEYDLNRFYKHLRKEAVIGEDDFNMEAAVSFNGDLYLFNRGTNTVFRISENEFEEYVREDSEDVGSLEFIKCKLPLIDKVQSGFSGACVVDAKIIFAASLERTTDWIDDGEILGSYVGYLDSKKFKSGTPDCTLLTEDGKTFLGKVESLVLTSATGKTIHLAAVTDEDNGNSVLLEIDLKVRDNK
ncbi:MAG: DUF6929 family protein [Flavobacteriales bacterium]